MSNKYAGICAGCNTRVPARSGELFKLAGKWRVRHNGCDVANDAEMDARESNARNTQTWVKHMRGSDSVVTTFNSGESVYVNRSGRCEDAPCCGCCS